MDNLTTVALLCDLTERNLSQGQAGTIVERPASDVDEVEFSNDEGRAYASLAVPAARLIQLHYQPVLEAAGSRRRINDQRTDS